MARSKRVRTSVRCMLTPSRRSLIALCNSRSNRLRWLQHRPPCTRTAGSLHRLTYSISTPQVISTTTQKSRPAPHKSPCLPHRISTTRPRARQCLNARPSPPPQIITLSPPPTLPKPQSPEHRPTTTNKRSQPTNTTLWSLKPR